MRTCSYYHLLFNGIRNHVHSSTYCSSVGASLAVDFTSIDRYIDSNYYYRYDEFNTDHFCRFVSGHKLKRTILITSALKR